MTKAHMTWLMIGLLTATAAGAAGQICSKVAERIDGDKKVCVYQCRMKQISTTIPATQACPRTVKQ